MVTHSCGNVSGHVRNERVQLHQGTDKPVCVWGGGIVDLVCSVCSVCVGTKCV